MTGSSDSRNRLLASLLPADFELRRPHLMPVELVHEAVLFESGDKIDRVYYGCHARWRPWLPGWARPAIITLTNA